MSTPRWRASLRAAPVLLTLWSVPLSAQVSDRYLERPPWAAGKTPPAAVVGHFPVVYQAGASHEALFDPSGEEGDAVAGLLREMNAYLDSLGLTVRLAGGGAAWGSPPDVSFGCEQDPWGECVERDDGESLGRAGTRMRLAVLRPSGCAGGAGEHGGGGRRGRARPDPGGGPVPAPPEGSPRRQGRRARDGARGAAPVADVARDARVGPPADRSPDRRAGARHPEPKAWPCDARASSSARSGSRSS